MNSGYRAVLFCNEAKDSRQRNFQKRLVRGRGMGFSFLLDDLAEDAQREDQLGLGTEPFLPDYRNICFLL